MSFKRCHAKGIGGDEVESIQLRCFADASEKAYGAVAASKSRVASLDKQTIPLLELSSNLTAASRLVKSVSQVLEHVVKVDDVVNWTNFMISFWG